jgi:hypothetical protein
LERMLGKPFGKVYTEPVEVLRAGQYDGKKLE